MITHDILFSCVAAAVSVLTFWLTDRIVTYVIVGATLIATVATSFLIRHTRADTQPDTHFMSRILILTCVLALALLWTGPPGAKPAAITVALFSGFRLVVGRLQWHTHNDNGGVPGDGDMPKVGATADLPPGPHQPLDLAERVARLLEPLLAKLDELARCVAALGKSGSPSDTRPDEIIDTTISTVVRILETRGVDFSPRREVRNEEIRHLLLDAFKKAEKRVDIECPWMTRRAVNKELKKRMEDALRRGVEIRILYGMAQGSPNSTDHLSETQSIADDLQKDFQRYGNLFRMKYGNTHGKVLLCDEEFSLVGSFNLLSFAGEYGADTRKETMDYSKSVGRIREYRANHFSF